MKAEASIFRFVVVSFHSDICSLQNEDFKTEKNVHGTRETRLQLNICLDREL